MLYLGLDSDNEDDWDSIIQLEIADKIRSFSFKNNIYEVSHSSLKQENIDTVISFNSNRYAIKKTHPKTGFN
jgi:hypothetical protein